MYRCCFHVALDATHDCIINTAYVCLCLSHPCNNCTTPYYIWLSSMRCDRPIAQAIGSARPHNSLLTILLSIACLLPSTVCPCTSLHSSLNTQLSQYPTSCFSLLCLPFPCCGCMARCPKLRKSILPCSWFSLCSCHDLFPSSNRDSV